MIFVTVGSRDYQFDRLIKKVDEIVENGKISDSFFLQIGCSKYTPKNSKYVNFLDKEDFKNYQDMSDIIITHGGTGSIVSALKKKKQVIAVPRLKKYGEHIDNHQKQVTSALAEQGYLLEVNDISELKIAIEFIKKNPIKKIYNKKNKIPKLLTDFISEGQNK